MKQFLILGGIFLLMIFQYSGCSSGSNADDIAAALSDRLTDALDFEGAEHEKGEKPVGSESPQDAPQINEVATQGDDKFKLGADFSVKLSSDFKEPEKVDKAVIYVKGATGYLIVPAKLVKNIMELPGTLKGDSELRNKQFTIEFALQTSNRVTGGYKPLGFAIKDEPPQEVGNPIETLNIAKKDERYHETGRPEGTDSTEAPQITSLDAPPKLALNDSFSVSLYTDFTDTNKIASAILTTPGNIAYYEIEGIVSESNGKTMMVINGSLAAEGISPGDELTFLWALKSTDNKVGVYRSWKLIVSEEAEKPGPQGRGVSTIFLYPTTISEKDKTQTRQTISPWADGINKKQGE